MDEMFNNMANDNKFYVTIGIPCYNVERFIAWSIKSVLNQTYKNFELIITDDGSTDHTVDIIKSIKDDRIILISDGENHGISYRLNQQIDMARGEIFIRMDGDDIMFPDRVEKQVNYLIEHQNVQVVGSPAVIIDNDDCIIGYREASAIPKKAEDVLWGASFIHPTVAGRLSFFKKYYYDNTLCGVEDVDLWCRGVGHNCYASMKESLMFYREPLEYKLHTYLYRLRQGNKLMVTRWGLFSSKYKVIKAFVFNIVKMFLATIMEFLKKDDVLIKRHNAVNITPEYYNILRQIKS